MAQADAVVVGGIAVLLVVLGGAIAGGRLWLLTTYDGDPNPEDRHTARLAGGTLLCYGVATGGFAGALWAGRAGRTWWLVWALLSVVVAFGVALAGADPG